MLEGDEISSKNEKFFKGRQSQKAEWEGLQDAVLNFFFFFLFVVDFVIHWNETAKGLHVFPIPIPPPTSLSTHSL